jgi:GMP synthase-like glutamine amidotransferase
MTDVDLATIDSLCNASRGSNPLKLAVLLTNTDTSGFSKRFPDDGQKVVAKLRILRPKWQYEVVSVKDSIFPSSIHDFDAYVLTGSPASVNDDEDWIHRLMAFIQELDAACVPTIGLCFGHQAIAKALGGKVGRPASTENAGWGLGFARTEFVETMSWMNPPQPSVKLIASHGEQVLELAPNSRVIGKNAFCPVASFTRGKHILTTEYHPEMSIQFIGELVEYLSTKLLDVVIANAKQQLRDASSDDSDLFMRWIVQFIENSESKTS